MKYFHLSGSLLVAMLAAYSFADELSEPGKKELQRLAGDWQIVSAMQDGKKQEQPAELTKIRIDENRLLIGMQEVGIRITLLDPTTKPRVINIEHPETKKTLEGIYELTDNQWKICINTEGSAERPSDFQTEGKSKFTCFELERVVK